MDDSNSDWDKKDDFFPVDFKDLYDIDDYDPMEFDPIGIDEIKIDNEEYQIEKKTLIERIRDELGITKEEFDSFISKIKVRERNKKETYEKKVIITKAGTQTGCTICNRRYVQLCDEALIFENAFYHLTYGKKFSRDIVTKLHNKICHKLDIGKMIRDDIRCIRPYFTRYLDMGFEIIREARNYIIEHPEFIQVIEEDKLKSKNK